MHGNQISLFHSLYKLEQLSWLDRNQIGIFVLHCFNLTDILGNVR